MIALFYQQSDRGIEYSAACYRNKGILVVNYKCCVKWKYGVSYVKIILRLYDCTPHYIFVFVCDFIKEYKRDGAYGATEKKRNANK